MRAAAAALILLLTFTANADQTRREEKDRIALLSEVHRQFLIDVEPVISEGERAAFLRLETAAQRDLFIDDFWRRRDKARGTTNNSARSEYYVLLEHVKEHFESVASDRGRIYLLYGPPTEVIETDCPPYQPMEIWIYPRIETLGRDVRLLFYLPRFRTEYKLWLPLHGKGASMAMSDLMRDPGKLGRGKIPCDMAQVDKALKAMSKYGDDVHVLTVPPAVNEEDVARILRSAVLASPGATKLDAELKVAYAGADGLNTNAQLSILVPRASLKTTAAGGASVYTLDVVGEVLRDDKMWEKYRYRFDFPGDAQDAMLPVVIDRTLRPGAYRSRVKLTDASSGAETILESDLVVPELAGKVLRFAQDDTVVATIYEDMQSSRARLRILPLGEDVTSGVQTIQTLVSGSGVKAVEFWLDGKKVATRRAPPYTLDLDFGTMPRARTIRVIALDAHDQPITGDEVTVNTGSDPFRVRITSPRVSPKLSGPTRVEMDVRVPEGKQLASLELYWNEQRVATMFDPPFVQTVNVPASESVGYLRAVATVEGMSVEDVVMVNTPNQMAEIDVHLVELPTTVLRDGKPVDHLAETAFAVFDEGAPVKLAKFEHVRDLPLSIGMAVDTSGSMNDKMAKARDAGAAFFTNVLKKGDKAFVVGFDSTPHMIQKWSGELAEIHTGLAKLRPEESTALYDAVVYSLYNFLGVKGQKALILLTDGKDTASKFSFEQALEYAQRAAVPIYAIGIGINPLELDVRNKLQRFCAETGGNAYYIDDVKDLEKIYAGVQSELRSQYVLGFYPSDVKPGGRWRELTVKVAEGKAKTIRGYYP